MFASVCEIGGMILELLKDGYSVELDGLGDFYLSAGSEGFEDPKKCTPHRVKARRVCFRMAPCVRKSMKFVKFERNPWSCKSHITGIKKACCGCTRVIWNILSGC